MFNLLIRNYVVAGNSMALSPVVLVLPLVERKLCVAVLNMSQNSNLVYFLLNSQLKLQSSSSTNNVHLRRHADTIAMTSQPQGRLFSTSPSEKANSSSHLYVMWVVFVADTVPWAIPGGLSLHGRLGSEFKGQKGNVTAENMI